eukprot:1147005-Pelagomonas_calceolata.AAC.1
MAFAYRIPSQQFVREHASKSRDRPHVPLWSGKTYLVLDGMYTSQVWGTEYAKKGQDFSNASTTHEYLIEHIRSEACSHKLGCLRGCGHVPLQFYWFKSAIKM